MKKIEELIEKSINVELENNFQVTAWYSSDVCEFLNINDESLQYLIIRTGKACLDLGWKKSHIINFIEKNNQLIITSVGVYQIIDLNFVLKKYAYLEEYVNDFAKLAVNDLIRYQGLKQTKSKKRKTNNENYEWEKEGEYRAKVFDKSLKTANLDIDDKSHLFYDKKIVITGTFENYSKRKIMAEMIHSVGGDNNTSVSKNTDYVIVGKNAGPSKMKKIADLGIETLNETEFIALFSHVNLG